MARPAPGSVQTETSSSRGDAQRESWAVRRYLNHLEAPRRRTGDPERLRARLAAVEAQLSDSPKPLERLTLLQARIDLRDALEAAEGGDTVDATELEDDFVAVAAAYSSRRGISWTAWRTVGVPAGVLRRAGIPRR